MSSRISPRPLFGHPVAVTSTTALSPRSVAAVLEATKDRLHAVRVFDRGRVVDEEVPVGDVAHMLLRGRGVSAVRGSYGGGTVVRVGHPSSVSEYEVMDAEPWRRRLACRALPALDTRRNIRWLQASTARARILDVLCVTPEEWDHLLAAFKQLTDPDDVLTYAAVVEGNAPHPSTPLMLVRPGLWVHSPLVVHDSLSPLV